MPINSNHLFEELNGIKCSIVEKEAANDRVSFLRELLEFNGFTVIVIPSPPPKVVATAPKLASPTGEISIPIENPEASQHPTPETFTVGVTNLLFNPTNAIFGRLLKTKDNHIVTLKYWEQLENISEDEIPYYESKY